MANLLPSKFVDKALEAPAESPEDPQSYLHESHHPAAPFTGNALKWESYVYDDGTTYEGLMKEDIPHGKGVMVFGNGSGGGIQETARGDKYEGEFQGGFAHGLGQYTSHDSGEVYRGEWRWGKRHGCGVMVNMSPFHNRTKKAGADPAKAWRAVRKHIRNDAIYGTWTYDSIAHQVGQPDDPEAPRYCSLEEINGTVQEMGSVLTRARMFQYKPDGEATLRMAQDATGSPAPLMQDPLHYGQGTKWMAPGPMGQCYGLPDSPELLTTLARHERNYERIYRMYNFDFVTRPGSDMEKAEKLHQAETRAKRAAAAEQDARNRARAEADARQVRQAEARRGRGRRGPAAPPPPEDINDEDLLASVGDSASGGVEQPAGSSAGSSVQQPGLPPPTVFASLSLGINRAALVLNQAMQRAATQAPRRRTLSRPAAAHSS